jgi:hypothetical protein
MSEARVSDWLRELRIFLGGIGLAIWWVLALLGLSTVIYFASFKFPGLRWVHSAGAYAQEFQSAADDEREAIRDHAVYLASVSTNYEVTGKAAVGKVADDGQCTFFFMEETDEDVNVVLVQKDGTEVGGGPEYLECAYVVRKAVGEGGHFVLTVGPNSSIVRRKRG